MTMLASQPYRARLYTALIVSAVIPACAHTNPAPNPPANSIVTTKTWVEASGEAGCSLTDIAAINAITKSLVPDGGVEALPILPLLAAQLLPELVSKLTSFAAAKAKEVGESYSFAAGATNVVRLPANPSIVGCFTVVRGVYSDTATSKVKELADRGLVGEPYFAFQGVLAGLGQHRYALVPSYVSFSSPGAERSSGDNKNVAVVLNIEGLGARTNPDAATTPQVPGPQPGKPSGQTGATKPQGESKPATGGSKPAAGAASKAGQDSSAPKEATAKEDAKDSAASSSESAPAAGFIVNFPALKLGTTLRYTALRDYQIQAFALQGTTNTAVGYTASVLETEKGGDLLLAFSKFVSDENNKQKIDSTLVDALKKFLPSTDKK